MSINVSKKACRAVAPIALASISLWLIPVYAHHGPGTSGGGTNTQSGETMKPGALSLELRNDYTEFKNVSQERADAKARNAGTFDLIDRTFLTTLSVGYGLAEDFQVGASLGWFNAVHAREVKFDPDTGETKTASFDPDGLADLWLTGKYRFLKGPQGQWAAFGGFKLPTGRRGVRNSEGEEVELSSTAGSGSYDEMIGLAYSRWLTSRVTLDASAQYTRRTERVEFRVGDRTDVGAAVAYRLTENVRDCPQVSLFAEAAWQHLNKNEDHDVRDSNTGGTLLFVSPGVRVGFSPNVSLTVAPQFPVAQNLHGEQQEIQLKLVTALTVVF